MKNNQQTDSTINIYINTLNINCQGEQSKEEQNQTFNLLAEVQKQTKAARKVFAEYLTQNKSTKADNVINCGSYITYKEYLSGKRKLNSINLCRERMCLNCQAALARKNARYMMKILSNKEKLYFLTLTVPNVPNFALKETIQNMYKAQLAFFRSMKIKDFSRSTEVTYNERTNKYHPHLHVIISGEIPIKARRTLQQEWAKWYNKQANTSHKWLSVLLEEVNDTFKSACELSKYACKPTSITNKTIETLYKQLKGLHLHQHSGTFKEEKKLLIAAEEQEKAAADVGIEDIDYKIVSYIFNGNNYIKAE